MEALSVTSHKQNFVVDIARRFLVQAPYFSFKALPLSEV